MKSRKLVKILGASGLAIMMGVGTLCGVLIAPMNSTHANTSANATTKTALTPEAQAKAELDANILAGGGLGLDPENDPIVATTDWGLDIKFHNVGEYQGAGYLLSNPSTNGTLSSGALSGYAYVTMGTYKSTAVNWVIIGYSTNGATGTGIVKATNLGIPDTTDAGNALKSASANGTLMATQYKLNAFTNAVGTSEIPGGCVLVISEKILVENLFEADYTDPVGAKFLDSDLRTIYLNLFNNDLGFTSTQKSKIPAQSLRSYYYDGSAITYCSTTDNIFPLASKTYWNATSYPQAFCVETYLSAQDKRLAYYPAQQSNRNWSLRSGHSSKIRVVYVSYTGNIDICYAKEKNGVRPVFVLKL